MKQATAAIFQTITKIKDNLSIS